MVFKEHLYQPFNKEEAPKISRRGFLLASMGALSFLAGKKAYEALASQPEQNQELGQRLSELKEGLTGKTLELHSFLADQEASEEERQQAQIALKLFEAFSLKLMVVDVMNQKLLAAKASGDTELETEIAQRMTPYIDEINQLIAPTDNNEEDSEPEADTDKGKILI
jgi:hypothetical protein